MKHINRIRAGITGYCMLALLALSGALFGAPGLVTGLFDNGTSGVLGTAYDRINTLTVTNATDMTAKARQEIWVRGIFFANDELYQENPFAAGMMGKPGSGKAVVMIEDTTKVHGNTINIPLVAGLGGPGVGGEGDRISKEQKLRIGNMQLQIGRFWFGVGITAVAKDETVIGGYYDEYVSDGLRELMAKKRSDDIMMEMIRRAGTSGRNYVLPDGVASRDALTSSDVVTTSLISRCGTLLGSNGAKPMTMGKDDAGSTRKGFVFMGTNFSLTPLESESAYLDARIGADIRGENNTVFTGLLHDWMGHGIYRWNNIDHGNYGPVGSPLVPRAFLGVAITGATTSTVVQGGGSAAAAAVTPAPLYFQFFSNAPYTFWNGDTIAAVTGTTRYIMILNPSGSYGVFKYRTNNGNQITLYTSPTVTIGVGTETTDFVEGALIVECNILGQPFCRNLNLGQQAVAVGTGTINGSKVSPEYGKRTEEHRNHDMDHAIGVEAVWGCKAVSRADGLYPNFLVVETALPIPGAPIIN